MGKKIVKEVQWTYVSGHYISNHQSLNFVSQVTEKTLVTIHKLCTAVSGNASHKV